ncbi:MAG: TrkH family potassium uptake protein [Bacteroidales bacterium]|nr:TrkH family potassium uptake protein [Candidatus Cryptobacteroides fimicaballi]
MNWKVISRYIGLALLVSSLFMFFSLLISLRDGMDSAFGPLLVSFIITSLVGSFPFIFVHKSSNISLKEGYVIIVLSWIFSFIFGMLPYALWGGPFSIDDAWFESVSGFTTTGSTALTSVEDLPRSLLFWRSSTHFIGGLGVVVFLLLIIPSSSPVRLRLTNMELSSMSAVSYDTRRSRTVYIFAIVYLSIFVLSFLSYLLAGMGVFDALNHAMSVSATGGFSTKNESIAAFGSFGVEAVSVVFMLASSLHFGLIYMCFVTGSLKPLNNQVTKFFLISVLVFSLLLALSLRINGNETAFPEALWNGLFQTVCIVSTTGFAVTDNLNWPVSANLLLLIAALMCGCAGSTTGGIKADRVLLLFKSIGLQVKKVLHPTRVNEIRMGNRFLRDGEASPHVLFICLYFCVLMVSILLTYLLGMNLYSSFAASISSLGNVGPAIRELGTFGNFSNVAPACKFVLTMDMFLGRIEIYPVLAVVAMIFDSRRRR